MSLLVLVLLVAVFKFLFSIVFQYLLCVFQEVLGPILDVPGTQDGFCSKLSRQVLLKYYRQQYSETGPARILATPTSLRHILASKASIEGWSTDKSHGDSIGSQGLKSVRILSTGCDSHRTGAPRWPLILAVWQDKPALFCHAAARPRFGQPLAFGMKKPAITRSRAFCKELQTGISSEERHPDCRSGSARYIPAGFPASHDHTWSGRHSCRRRS